MGEDFVSYMKHFYKVQFLLSKKILIFYTTKGKQLLKCSEKLEKSSGLITLEKVKILRYFSSLLKSLYRNIASILDY